MYTFFYLSIMPEGSARHKITEYSSKKLKKVLHFKLAVKPQEHRDSSNVSRTQDFKAFWWDLKIEHEMIHWRPNNPRQKAHTLTVT